MMVASCAWVRHTYQLVWPPPRAMRSSTTAPAGAWASSAATWAASAASAAGGLVGSLTLASLHAVPSRVTPPGGPRRRRPCQTTHHPEISFSRNAEQDEAGKSRSLRSHWKRWVVLVNFIREHVGVPVVRELGDEPEFLTAEDLARRVVRGVDDDRPRALVERGAQLSLVDRPVRLMQGHEPRD